MLFFIYLTVKNFLFVARPKHLHESVLWRKAENMSGTMARQIETPVKRIPSGRVLAVGDGNAADAPLGNGFEQNTVVEAKSWPEPTNAPTAW